MILFYTYERYKLVRLKYHDSVRCMHLHHEPSLSSRKLFLAALEADPNSSYSHKWMGIMLGKVSAIDGTKQQLIISPKIKVKCHKFKTF